MNASQAQHAMENAEECRRMARYLVGRDPEPQLVERYRRAVERLLPAPASSDRRILEYIQSNPWSLGPLDAACGLLRKDAQLRQRLLIATAILETTPKGADRFLPERRAPWTLLPEIAWHGAVAAAKAVAGAVILLAVIRA